MPASVWAAKRRQRGIAILAAAAPLLLSLGAPTVWAAPKAKSKAHVADEAAKPKPATARIALPNANAKLDAENAVTAGLLRGEPFAELGVSAAKATEALKAFRISCPSVQRRTDLSGLTQGSDWTEACTAAATWPDRNARKFFAQHFQTIQVGAGTAMATGYYEPEISGSRTQSAAYPIPIYRRPPDLLEINLGEFVDDLKGRTIRGRVIDGKLVRYPDRAAIVEGALAGQGLEIAYAADAAEFFFLQIQGSGRVRLPDGQIMRIGYDSQNGRGYVGIGKLLLDRGALAPGQANMQGILKYLREDPVRGAQVMNENPSWVFFRELKGAGPLGALGLPVTPRASVAADPRFIPLGAPVFLSMDRSEPNGLWIAQDTGGAIKGANRVDTFWGAGEEARAIAGGMAARGSALLLLPNASIDRLLPVQP
jgi:membrane-bound lytic murein transglycosylase A